jgi:hypothetical protein
MICDSEHFGHLFGRKFLSVECLALQLTEWLISFGPFPIPQLPFSHHSSSISSPISQLLVVVRRQAHSQQNIADSLTYLSETQTCLQGRKPWLSRVNGEDLDSKLSVFMFVQVLFAKATLQPSGTERINNWHSLVGLLSLLWTLLEQVFA